MVARIPLIVNSSAEQIQELPSGDSISIPGDLDVTGSITGNALYGLKLTADGTIAANAAVVLTSAGKAKAISTVAESFGSPGTWFTNGGGVEVKAINFIHWDNSQNAAIVNWTDGNDARRISVGTLSGTTMTWASPSTAGDFGSVLTHAIATNGEGGGIVVYKLSATGDLLYKTFTLSGNTMTLGNAVTISAYHVDNNDSPERQFIEYLEKEGSSHYFAFSYRYGDDGANGMKAKMRIIKWDGQNNVTLGDEVAYENATATSTSDRAAIWPRLIALENSRYLIYDRSGYKVCTRVGTDFRISNTTNTLIGAIPEGGKAPVYDPRTKTLLTVNQGVSPAGVVIYSIDGERIDYRFQTDLPENTNNGHIEMTDKGEILYSYFDGSGSGNAKRLIGTFNDTRDYVTWSGPSSWASDAGNMGAQPRTVKANDGKVVKVYFTGSAGSRDGKSVVVQTPSTTLTEDNFLGFSAAGYSNGNTAKISLSGSTTTKSSLTIGKKYYVQDNGTLGTTKESFDVVAGKALSATSLLITEV